MRRRTLFIRILPIVLALSGLAGGGVPTAARAGGGGPTPSQYLSEAQIRAATRVEIDQFNPQLHTRAATP